MKKKKTERLSIWTAFFADVGEVDDAGKQVTTTGTIRAYTVAATQKEAIAVMREGLLTSANIESVGRATQIQRVAVRENSDDFIKKVQPIVYGTDPVYQFIVPLERLSSNTGAIGFLLWFWLYIELALRRSLREIARSSGR